MDVQGRQEGDDAAGHQRAQEGAGHLAAGGARQAGGACHGLLMELNTMGIANGRGWDLHSDDEEAIAGAD